ncbi:MAG: alanyl-tRNA editing protein [Lachnospiraceae bacterium]|nr:alanyl-tRNA editing protein [Lachnospiraceae bacterium]
MVQTTKLYEQDSHLKEFDAVILVCEELAGGYRVVLDKTAFFPEGGGQSSDTGYIGELRVTDVQEEKGVIWHTALWEDECRALKQGETVHGRIDWERRFVTMQQHSGEHIVSGLVHARFGYDNVGFHVGSTEVTLDFNGMLSEAQLREIEREANQKVVLNLPIKAWYPSSEELAALPYRSKKEIDGALRIVEIPDCDRCACCAPHVSLTGEIGMIKLTGVQKYKSGVRVSMLCGFLALDDYNRKEESVRDISVLLSAKQDEVAKSVSRQKDEVAALKEKQTNLYKMLCEYRAAEIEEGSDRAVCFVEKEMSQFLRHLGNLAAQRVRGYAAIFAGNDADGWQYILTAAKQDGETVLPSDMKLLAKRMNEALSGRGGGSPQMAQGSLPALARKAIEDFLNAQQEASGF